MDESNTMRTDVDGRRVKIRVIKNKTSDEAKGIAFYDVIRGVGFDMTAEVIDLALECGAIKHGGGGHYTCGKRKIHGRAKLRAWIEESEKVRDVLTRAVETYLAKTEVEDASGHVDDEDFEL